SRDSDLLYQVADYRAINRRLGFTAAMTEAPAGRRSRLMRDSPAAAIIGVRGGRNGRGPGDAAEEEAMHLMYFTEQPMSAYPSDIGLATGHTALMFSNKYFDPVAGSRLYNEYLEHYIMVDELGFDGIMLNEHHNAPFCMQAKANIFAAILAAVTKNVKIVMLGNPLPLAENPVRLAEELAMIDMISKGRLVSGFVRGGGQEQLAAGVKGGPDYHGLLKQIHVAETEEKAIENAAQFRWMQGEFTGLAHPVWSTPSGYGSPVNRRAFVEFASGRASNPRGRPSLEKQMDELMIIAGTPKTVIAKLRILLEETRPGILGMWGNDGTVTHEDAKTCIRLMGEEVLP